MIRELKSALLFLTFVYGDKDKHDCSSAPSGNISCHDTYIKDDLPSADTWEFPENSIFFVESSCKGGLDSRQACAVESAARANPLWQINVLFAGPVYAKCRKKLSLFILSRYRNIKLFRIHPLELAKDTPLEDFLAMNPLESSSWPVCHASDILRYLILYKWGGVYLDLDMVVLKPFDGLAKNWGAKETVRKGEVGVASGALAFSGDFLGREVSTLALEQMVLDFRGWKWSHNGPGVIYRALRRLCLTNDPVKMSTETCHGFAVYDSYLFYPVLLIDAQKLFDKGHLDLGSAYTCHVWTTSRSGQMRVHRHSPYAALAALHCPRVHARFGRLFGTVGKV